MSPLIRKVSDDINDENNTDSVEADSVAGGESRKAWDLRERVLKQVKKKNAEYDDEEVVYEQHMKLFEFTGDKWISLGFGNMRFLCHTEEGITYGTIRMITTEARSGKKLCNHYIEPSIEIKESIDEKGCIRFTWVGIDYAKYFDGGDRTFAVRFKKGDETKATEWRENFENCIIRTYKARCGLDCADTSAADDLIKSFRSIQALGKSSKLKRNI